MRPDKDWMPEQSGGLSGAWECQVPGVCLMSSLADAGMMTGEVPGDQVRLRSFGLPAGEWVEWDVEWYFEWDVEWDKEHLFELLRT